MVLTPRQLALATLERQFLLERRRLDVAEAVRRVCALQAQEPASPYLALWNRVRDFAPEDLDAAFAEGRVVKASLMRITLHAVHAEDYAHHHAAMLSTLRASRLYDRRFGETGLSPDDVDALFPELAAFLAQPRTGVEVRDELAGRFGEHADRVWWALRTYGTVHHAPTGGPWSFTRRNAYRAAAPTMSSPGTDTGVDPGEGVRRLLLSYLGAFGPATARDFARFTLLTSPVIKQALHELDADGRVVRVPGPDRAPLFDLPEATVPDEDTPAPPRLLPMWDSTLLAHAGPGRLMPVEYRPLVVRRNGDVLPCLLVDGQVAGVWRAREGALELTAFRAFDAAAWEGLVEEAEGLLGLLATREPEVYRRYGHWWDKGPLTGVGTRTVTGG
ncbi:winged helix DNA-binding domain-containing protein [Streptomyces sp. CO7]